MTHDVSDTTDAVNRRIASRDARSAPVLVAIFIVAFALQLLPRITAPFGDSHDGRNGGVWGMAARAIRHDGLMASRIGARIGKGTPHEQTYAHHPPPISIEPALAQAALGDSHLATRLPAWLGSLVTVVLTYLLARRCGLRPLAAAIGTVLGLGSPMFFVFGGMLDTPVIALPWAVGLALAWQAARSGQGRVWPVALVSALAAWQSILLAGFLAVAATLRRRPRLAIGVAARTGIGVVAVVAWAAWASGSLSDLRGALSFRAGPGTADATVPAMLAAQRYYLRDTLPTTLWILGPLTVAIGIADRRTRDLVAALVATPVAYCLLLLAAPTTTRTGRTGFPRVWPLLQRVPATLSSAISRPGSGRPVDRRGACHCVGNRHDRGPGSFGPARRLRARRRRRPDCGAHARAHLRPLRRRARVAHHVDLVRDRRAALPRGAHTGTRHAGAGT